MKILILLAVFLTTFASLSQAKDVSAQQAGVEYARQEVAKTEALHKKDIKELSDSEILLTQRKKAFEQQNKQVAEDKKKAEASKKQVEEANAKLTKAQANLDQAWKD
jgi:multidrug resistance efflux pump